MTRPRADLTNDELALAYELKQTGCCWKRIAEGLSCNDHDLRSAVSYAIRHGIKWRPSRFYPAETIIAALVMRGRSKFSWRSIAEHLGATNAHSIRLAVRRFINDR